MKPMHVAEDILPLGEFKRRASEILRSLREHKRPYVITQHGRPAAVLLVPEEFDRLVEHQWFVRSVQQGLEDADAGRTLSDEDLTRALEAQAESRAS